eukprot:9363285-Lingulodinium_polyedra.AAC.1
MRKPPRSRARKKWDRDDEVAHRHGAAKHKRPRRQVQVENALEGQRLRLARGADPTLGAGHGPALGQRQQIRPRKPQSDVPLLRA